MPVTRSLLLTVPVSLAVAAIFVPLHRTAAAPDPTPPEPAARPAGTEVEVRCVDDSVIKLRILEEKLELVTKYGFLQVPVADIRRIDFAHRCPADVGEKIALAVSKLGHPDFQTRERASAELRGYRERAYPFLLKALKHDDPEVSRRADEAVKYLHAHCPAGALDPRESDVVYTEDSKITGKLTAQAVRVSTSMFGEQSLRLADLRGLRSGAGVAADDLAGAVAGPATLSNYQQQFGKELVFTVTGFTPGGGQQPGLWGTDTYTLDSSLAAAAVHAGLVKPGESGAVRVRIVQSPPQYASSFRNGVSSAAYGSFPSGAFEFVRK